MKIKRSLISSTFILFAVFVLNPLSTQAQITNSSCKCAQTETASQCSSKENACKCGSACKCKQSGDKSNCKCGANCQCHTGHSITEHNHPASVNPFLQIMDTMMVVMDAVPLTSSVERNFLAQMIPHHQAAIEMAKYEIANGKNFEMIQLAKSILAEQQGEIMDMQAMLAGYPAGNGIVSPAYKAAMYKTMEVMMTNTPTDAQLPEEVDCCFSMIMLPHHQAAVDMAVAVLKFNPESQVATYARRIIGDQMVEIEQMNEYINKNCKK